jgi:hypothetical protein
MREDVYGMQVLSFTPAVATIFKPIPRDMRRPLTDLVHRLDYPSNSCEEQLDPLTPIQSRTLRPADWGAGR